MKKLFTTIFVTAIIAASLAFAQSSGQASPTGRVQHRVAFLTKLLDLTSAQQQQATSIFTSAASSVSGIRSNMKSAHQSLETAVQQNNSAAIEQYAATIGNLTGEITAADAKAEAAFYQILTPEQQSKLTQFEQAGHGRFQGGMSHGSWAH